MRRFLASGLIAGVMMSTMAFVAPVAQAGSSAQSTSCHLKATVRFNPGLDYSAEHQQKVRVRGKLTNCAGGGVTGAFGRGRGGGSLSCTSGTATVTLHLTWNTTETSTVSLVVDLGAQTLSGKVTSGKFAGEDVTVSNVTFTILEGDCIFTPVTKARVTGTAGL